jgi:hypothetical protein
MSGKGKTGFILYEGKGRYQSACIRYTFAPRKDRPGATFEFHRGEVTEVPEEYLEPLLEIEGFGRRAEGLDDKPKKTKKAPSKKVSPPEPKKSSFAMTAGGEGV